MNEDGKLIVASGFLALDLMEKTDDFQDVLRLWGATSPILRRVHFDIIHVVKPKLKDFLGAWGKRDWYAFRAGIRKANYVGKITALVIREGRSAGHGKLHLRRSISTFPVRAISFFP